MLCDLAGLAAPARRKVVERQSHHVDARGIVARFAEHDGLVLRLIELRERTRTAPSRSRSRAMAVQMSSCGLRMRASSAETASRNDMRSFAATMLLSSSGLPAQVSIVRSPSCSRYSLSDSTNGSRSEVSGKRSRAQCFPTAVKLFHHRRTQDGIRRDENYKRRSFLPAARSMSLFGGTSRELRFAGTAAACRTLRAERGRRRFRNTVTSLLRRSARALARDGHRRSAITASTTSWTM